MLSLYDLLFNGATSSRLKTPRCLLNYRNTRCLTVLSIVVSLFRSAVRFFPVFDESVGFSSLQIASVKLSARYQRLRSLSPVIGAKRQFVTEQQQIAENQGTRGTGLRR